MPVIPSPAVESMSRSTTSGRIRSTFSAASGPVPDTSARRSASSPRATPSASANVRWSSTTRIEMTGASTSFFRPTAPMVPSGLRLVEDLRYGAAMPLNQSLKGRLYDEIRLTVARDEVLRFADAIGEDDPVFRDPESAGAAGQPDQLAPPAFVPKMQIMASAMVIVDQDLGLDYSRVVHGEQEYEWHRPIVVGDVLTATPRISDIYAKKSNEYLIIEAEIRDATGDVVVVSRATLLSRGTGEG